MSVVSLHIESTDFIILLHCYLYCMPSITFIVLEFLDAQMHAYFHGGMPIFTVNIYGHRDACIHVNMGIGMPIFA